MKPVYALCLFVCILFIVHAPAVPVHAAGTVSEAIQLPQPATDGTVSIERALRERRSVRNFSDAPLALAELSQLLWAAQGITGPGSRRTAPSAGALYPLELYVLAGSVSGLDAGIYLYKPEGHRLLLIAAGDRRGELRAAAHGQVSMEGAPAVFVISAVFERSTIKYGERGNRYVHLEAGHAAQNICLQAVALKLGSVVIGAFDDDAVKKAAHLSVREQPLYLIPVGKPQSAKRAPGPH